MARRTDPKVQINGLLDTLNGNNEGAYLGALRQLRKVLEQQNNPLPGNLKHNVVRTLRSLIAPYRESVSVPTEAVYCLGVNVVWDRQQEKWLNAQREEFAKNKYLPVIEAINEVFRQQRQRHKNVRAFIRRFREQEMTE